MEQSQEEIEFNNFQPFKSVMRFFVELEKNKILYCHFKSNQHLGEGLVGITDLDVLVDKTMSDKCTEILIRNGFKRFNSQPWLNYPGIEDWLTYDEERAKIIHLHLHYHLLSGVKFVKEQHLPWERLLLETRVRHPHYSVYVTDPNLEILLLMARIGIKLSALQLLNIQLGIKPFPKEIKVEFDYLYRLLDWRKVEDYALILFGEMDGRKLIQWIKDKQFEKIKVIRSIRTMVKKHYKEHQRYTGLKLRCIQMTRFYMVAMTRIKRRFNLKTQRAKRPHSGGLIIALVGADGSGKSTISRSMIETFYRKIDIQKIYLGSGDGRVSPTIWLSKKAWSIVKRIRGKKKGTNPLPKRKKKLHQSQVKNIIDALFAIFVANHRYRTLKKAYQDKLNGCVIVSDRFPQNQFSHLNDGPYIHPHGRESWFERIAMRVEQRRFDRFPEIQPDLVIKLRISLEVAHERKPVYSPADIKEKIEMIDELDFSKSEVEVVDATLPLDKVKKKVFKLVWDKI